MAARGEIFCVYAAGLIQGVALVTFPAANAVFTSSSAYGLSNTEYGGMFVPQAVLAIAASLLGAAWRKRAGTKRIYLVGLLANLLAMGLLVVSQWAMKDHAWAYAILLAATGCLGAGFGFTVPALNTLASAFFPKKTDRAVLVLNALLGLGTALAPLFVAIFVRLGFWWGLPALVGVLLMGVLWFSLGQPLDAGANASASKSAHGGLPSRFWIFGSFALLYGVGETMNGTWAVPYMTKHLGASASVASLALAIFWGMVTGGRLLFAGMEKWWSERIVCRVLPWVVSAAFVALAFVPQRGLAYGFLLFALAGLGCSALLPLTISFGQRELKTMAASAAGTLIACYQVGYGIAAFGVGPLQSSAGLSLATLFGGAAMVAVVMAVLAFFVSRHRPIR